MLSEVSCPLLAPIRSEGTATGCGDRHSASNWVGAVLVIASLADAQFPLVRALPLASAGGTSEVGKNRFARFSLSRSPLLPLVPKVQRGTPQRFGDCGEASKACGRSEDP
jgi:hypothetical protein